MVDDNKTREIYTTIRMTWLTVRVLNDLKIHPRQSYEDVIKRLIDLTTKKRRTKK